jgi:DNA-binding CsgD family transcriptional regulator
METSAECFAGEGRVVTIAGPVGSGKTELVRTFAERVSVAGALFVGSTASYTERTLALGVVGQIFHGVHLPGAQCERVAALLHDGMLGSLPSMRQPDITEPLAAGVLDDLCTEILEIARRQPLVIGIDDLHHADPPSLQCLSRLIRRFRSAPVMVVLIEATRWESIAALDPDLLTEPRHRHIQLDLFSPTSVRVLVRRPFGAATADRLAPVAYTVSGGNPLLVGALIEDTRATDPRDGTLPLVAGKAFRQAYLRCLYRCDATMIKVARWLAVLGADATSARVARLAELPEGPVVHAIRALDASGLLAGGRFAAPAARAAVLDGLPAEAHTAMHGQAAVVLYNDGATVPMVAGHLLTADDVTPSWAAEVLCEAAEQTLATGDTDRALALLGLALRADVPAPQRAATLALLVSAHWRVDPSVAMRHLPELTAAVRAGHVTGLRALSVVSWLSWFGQVDEAADLLVHLRESAGAGEDGFRAQVRGTQLSLAHLYPGRLDERRTDKRGLNGPPATHPEIWAASLLAGALSGRAGDALAGAGQQLLEYELDERTWPVVRVALAALTYGEQFDAAARCCGWFLRQAEEKQAVVWQAVLTSLRAAIALRRGDLSATEHNALAALALVPPKSWGIQLGYPVALLVRACTAMGRPDEALGHLRLPVPDAMFRSTVGLGYLQARGVYYRTVGRHSAALSDFHLCGEVAKRWDIDLPLLVPWRSDAAQTWLRLGQPDRARELAGAELQRLPSGPSRVRGACLRVLAATRQPKQRVALLRQAVETLNACGDRIELVPALTELSQEYDALGQSSPARKHATRARTIASKCGLPLATAAQSRILPVRETPRTATAVAAPSRERVAAARTEPKASADRVVGLSDAERRVVLLATQGLTNRQIAAELHVTVSTVEQHLTKTYRKLRVSRRADLPIAIQAADGVPHLAQLP